jgi:hypothetical protein
MKFGTSRISVPSALAGGLEVEFVKNTRLYKMQVAIKEEILRHKWIESEKAGRDMGFEWALMDWVCKHKTLWTKGLGVSDGKTEGKTDGYSKNQS